MPKLQDKQDRENSIQKFDIKKDYFDLKPHRDFLESHFNSFINTPAKTFFLGIADYIKYIEDNENLWFIRKEASAQYEEAYAAVTKLQRLVETELEDIVSDLRYEVIENHIDIEGINIAIDDYHEIIDRQHLSQRDQLKEVYTHTKRVVQSFANAGYYTLIQKYVELDDDLLNIVHFKFTESYDKYITAAEDFEDNRKTSLWGNWLDLFDIYTLVFNFKDYVTKLREKNDVNEEIRVRELKGFIKLTLEGMDVDANPFKSAIYKYKVEKLHNFIIGKLRRFENYSEQQVKMSQEAVDAIAKSFQEPMKQITEMIKRTGLSNFNPNLIPNQLEIPITQSRKQIEPIPLERLGIKPDMNIRGMLPASDTKVIKWGDIEYNYDKCVLSNRKTKQSIPDLSPEYRLIKFMRVMDEFKIKNTVAEYRGIIKIMAPDDYKYWSDKSNTEVEPDNDNFAEKANYLRRDLKKLFLSTGMTSEEFDKMFITVKKRGYRIATQ